MKKTLTFFLFFLLAGFIVKSQTAQPPDVIYGELFRDIQMAKIFPDGKTFVDCTPKRDPKEIVKDYLAVKNNPAIKFSLKFFVDENFELPHTPNSTTLPGKKM